MPLRNCFPCLQFNNDAPPLIKELDYSNLSSTVLNNAFAEIWQYERTLETLNLNSTRLESLPPQLFYCQGLQTLILSNNNLTTAAMTPAIGTLKQLQHLNLSRNYITKLPTELKACKNLVHLDLSCNNLQRLPEVVTCIISLQELLLNETLLEFLPANFGRLVNLRILELRLNALVSLPKSMNRLTNLHRLDIGGNEFSEMPDVICELPKLQELWIDSNQIRRIQSGVRKLKDLKHLEATDNLIDSLPEEVENWGRIEVLSLCLNSLKQLPQRIGMLRFLVTLKCESCYLHELPDAISGLEHLEELVISHNKIAHLPRTIGKLKRLSFLFADDNDLADLPEELCDCEKLSVLSLSRNKLNSIPHHIGRLTNLKVLNLVANRIQVLPASVLNLGNLTSLWLSDNQSQPLVPLQYVDGNARRYLSCFMLPQDAYLRHRAAEEMKASSDALAMQDRKFSANPNAAQSDVLSPLKRICFAENTEFADNRSTNDSYSAAKTNCADAEVEPLHTHLLRSPTPYPKELRLMAKNMRNNHRPPPPHNGSPESACNIKEARIVSNSKRGVDICDNNSSNSNFLPTSAIDTLDAVDNNVVDFPRAANCVPTPATLLRTEPASAPNANVVVAQELGNFEVLGNMQYCSEFMQPTTMPTYIAANAALTETGSFYNNVQNFTAVPLMNQNFAALDTFSGHYQPTQEQIYVLSQNPGNYDIPPSEAMHLYNSVPLPVYRMPPQYKAAGSEQAKPASNAANEISNTSNNISHNTSNTNVDQTQLSNKEIPFVDHQNNMLQKDGTQTAMKQFPINAHHQPAPNNYGNSSSCPSPSPQMAYADDNSSNISANESSITKPKKSTWLFGTHKNPTVQEVAVRLDGPDFGFDIQKTPGVNGIWIGSVKPNSQAARSLHPHDKLLEINGIDFTSITIQEARHVLSNLKTITNIMISRNK